MRKETVRFIEFEAIIEVSEKERVKDVIRQNNISMAKDLGLNQKVIDAHVNDFASKKINNNENLLKGYILRIDENIRRIHEELTSYELFYSLKVESFGYELPIKIENCPYRLKNNMSFFAEGFTDTSLSLKEDGTCFDFEDGVISKSRVIDLLSRIKNNQISIDEAHDITEALGS